MKLQMNRFKNFIIANKWIVIGIILVTLFVFSNYLYGYKLSFTNVNYEFQPYNSYGIDTKGPMLSDIADSEYPLVYKIFYSNTGFSLWDSDLALGAESNTIAQLMNPMKWVYVLPFEMAIFLKCFSEFAIAFFSMFLFLRALGMKKYPAALGGIIYTFSSVIVAWMGWAHSDVAAWAPLLFFAIEKLISTIKLKYIFLSAFTIYVMLMVGMPTYAAYFLYLAGVYIVLFTFIRHWHNKKNIFIIGGMFALSVILAALASLPYTYTLLNNVVGNGYADSRTSYAKAVLSTDYLRTFIFPNIRDGIKQLHTNESTLYVGVISVILLPFTLFNVKNKKRTIFFLLASVVTYILIFSNWLDFIYTRLPLINTSLKYRVITLLMFSMAVLTAITINDIIENKEYYKKKLWLLAVLVLWAGAVFYFSSKDVYALNSEDINNVILLASGIVICIAFLFRKNYKFIYILLAVLIVLDSSQFANKYLPWIDAEADIIPKATDSVTYLMENTSDHERIAGMGDWTFFPNTPSYYELNDIRIHGFTSTNSDFTEYFTEIDENSYLTRTRTTLNKVQNYELLKYLGVRYIYGSSLGNCVPIANDEGNSDVLGIIPSYTTVSQDIYLEKDLSIIQILFATYGTKPQNQGNIHLTVTSKNDGLIVSEKDIPINTLRDNTYLNVSFENNEISEPGLYTFTLSFENLGDETITIWTKKADDSVIYYGDETVPGSMAMNAIYEIDEYEITYTGADSLSVAELSEYSNKVELVENLYVYVDDKEVLSTMKNGYLDNTAFMVSDNESEQYNIPLKENEKIELLEYDDDYIKILCTSEYDRYVMVNDYYDDNWSAYVDGQKVDIDKVNFLMRAVKISEGKDMIIEFKYEPTRLYAVTACSGITLAIVVLLLLLRRRLQNRLDSIIAR